MKYPIGIQSFEKIRQNGYVYVDKTDLIYKLAKGSVYFLARPRRFGKSLLCSTLKCYFEGQRELFEGLKIMDLEQEWTTHPVITFDFNLVNKQRAEGLHDYIIGVIAKLEDSYGIIPAMDYKDGRAIPTPDVARRFDTLIAGLHQKTEQPVVVTVDEYDKPLLDLLDTDNPDDEQQLVANRELLKGFFSTFKAADRHLRFVLLTGVTKFSQITMFSGTNQPDDISLDSRYDTLLGITEPELHTVFADAIHEMANAYGYGDDKMKELLKQRYDGYHFSNRMMDVYNPFSILNAFEKNTLGDYWIASGNPTYAVRLLGKTQEDVMSFTMQEHTLDEFLNYKADVARPLPMIFQAGYLTIKSFDPEMETYRLDFPNVEVRRGFIALMANNYLQLDERAVPWVVKIVKAMRVADLEQVRRLFTAFLAETPYSMRPKKDQKDRELYFHYTFYLLMRLISCYTVYTEKQLSEGRVDCIVETPQYIYIFEFKLDGTADEALQQIHDRGYATAYSAERRAVFQIGASFSSKTGTVEEWKVEELKD